MTIQDENKPETTVASAAPAKAAKAARKPAKAAAKPAKGKAAKPAAKPAKGKGKGKAEAKEARERVDHVSIIRDLVGRKRIVWANKPCDWPQAALESGKAAEAEIKAAGRKGLTWDDYTGSVNRLGYMIRKEAVTLSK